MPDEPLTWTATRGVPPEDKFLAESLAGLHRAISAWQFYPPRHPILEEALRAGAQTWERSAEDPRWEHPGLVLRSGTLWAGDAPIGEGNPAVDSMARIFANHGVVGLRRTGSLSPEGYSWLVATLATAPDQVADRGGICAVLQEEPSADALALETLAITAGEGEGAIGGSESDDSEPHQQAEPQDGAAESLADLSNQLEPRLDTLRQRSPQERVLVGLLLRLRQTEENEAFLDLLDQIARFVHSYLEMNNHREAFDVVWYLHQEALRREEAEQHEQRDNLFDAIRRLVRGDSLDWLVRQVTSSREDETEKLATDILRVLGEPGVVPVINALSAEKVRAVRRHLIDLLVAVGEPVVPPAIEMLADRRWFVARNMVDVLGGIGSSQAWEALVPLIRDPDPRIRREVALVLRRSRGAVAEEALLALLADPDPVVRQMAVVACGNYGSERILDAVWRVYRKARIRKEQWELKVVALHAVERMGLESAERRLLRILGREHWFFRDRWLRVRCAAAIALGALGGAEAERSLARYKKHGDPELRAAAARALKAIAQRAQQEP